MEFVDSEDAAWRATLGSVRKERTGDAVRVIPDVTSAMASDLLFRELPAQLPAPVDFHGLFSPGSADWERFFSTRKVVHRYTEAGDVVASVTSNVVEALGADVSAGRGNEKRPKEYEVVHLLSDVSLRDKFRLYGEFWSRMRNLAVMDTPRAARKLQEYVRTFEGSERACVVVGKYAGTWKAARDCVNSFSSRHPGSTVRVDACFINDKVFMYGPEGEDGWRVFGPMKCAGLVMAVYNMVQASSCAAVAFAFGLELTLLDIDVHDGQQVVCPSRQYHAGDHDELETRPLGAVGSLVSRPELERLAALGDACETVAVDGINVATAVRITSKFVLINAHVVNEDGVLTSNGRPVAPLRMVSADLWLCQVRGPEVAWALREAEANEEVILCYRRHGELQALGPVTVKSVSKEMVTTTLTHGMAPGVSGAAVVSLRDFSLLAVYDGSALRQALCAAFVPSMYTDICSMSEAGDSCRASARDEGIGLYAMMKNRGLGKMVDAAMAATVPLYSGDMHVGMGFRMGHKLLTTCNPDVVSLTPLGEVTPVVFSREVPYFSAEMHSVGQGPAVVRPPSYGEKVFVVGRDNEGDYVSSSTTSVVHIGVGSNWFQVSAFDQTGALPLQGGLVVAVADAAVVGAYQSSFHDSRRGSVVQCVALPKAEVTSDKESLEEGLVRVFPFLRPKAWPEGVLSAVLTHSSVLGASKMTEYAAVGDAAVRLILMERLLAGGVPTKLWSGYVQTDQSNTAQSAACERLGLDSLVITGGGLRVLTGSKVKADVLEAVAGAVHLYEPSSTFEKYCEVAGMLRESYEDTVGGAER